MGSPIKLKQKLSPKAAAAKKRRDTVAAKTPKRRARKAENQRIGQSSEYDLHHKADGSIYLLNPTGESLNYLMGTIKQKLHILTSLKNGQTLRVVKLWKVLKKLLMVQ